MLAYNDRLGKWAATNELPAKPRFPDSTKNNEVACTYLVIMRVCLPVLYILHVTGSAVQGMGIAEVIMRTGGVLLLPPLIGETGIFIAEVLAWAGADMILIPSYFITTRKAEKEHRSG